MNVKLFTCCLLATDDEVMITLPFVIFDIILLDGKETRKNGKLEETER